MFGIADCFLLDNTLKKAPSYFKQNAIVPAPAMLFYLESNSFDELKERTKDMQKNKIKYLTKRYATYNYKSQMTLCQFIKDSLPPLYIVEYEKLPEGVKVLSKKPYDLENIEKLLVLL